MARGWRAVLIPSQIIGINARSVNDAWKCGCSAIGTSARIVVVATIAGVPKDRTSAGILLFRRTPRGIEVLLGHPGGPIFARRDEGVWSIPKGLVEAGEDLLSVGEREFLEETGQPAPAGPRLDLGSIVQRGGKTVHTWAVEGDLDASTASSNLFQMEWPPRSGRIGTFPEIDRVAWFSPAEAALKANPAQVELIERLQALLDA